MGTISLLAGNTHPREQPVQAWPEPSDRPPNTIGLTLPSSSGMATIKVLSNGANPSPDLPHDSSVWNSKA